MVTELLPDEAGLSCLSEGCELLTMSINRTGVSGSRPEGLKKWDSQQTNWSWEKTGGERRDGVWQQG